MQLDTAMKNCRRSFMKIGVGLCVVMAQPAFALARVDAESRVTFFQEPGRKHDGVTVIHPQTDVNARLGDSASVSAGYELDIVSGATPAVFSRAAVDAITAPTRFDDTRQTARASLGWNASTVGLNAGYSYGWESDYRSHTMQVAARGDFLDRNFTLNLAYTRNFDSVCDQNNAAAQAPIERRALASSTRCFQGGQTETITRGLGIDTFEPSLSWTVTPRLFLQAGVTLQVLDGFQSNPYRRVLIGSQGRTPQENVPEHRQRYALFGRLHYAIPAARAAVLLFGRAYRDSWDIHAASAELMVRKYLAAPLILQLRARVHDQTGAVFYRSAGEYEDLGPTGRYWTGDRELSPLRTLLTGAKLAYIRRNEAAVSPFFDEIEVNMKFEALFYDLSEGAPNSDRTYALIGQIGLALRF